MDSLSLAPTIDAATDNPPEKIKKLFNTLIQKSKRQGAWFRLSRQERGICSLAMRLKVKFESMGLLRALVSIMKKLGEFGESQYARLMWGTRLAWAFSAVAVNWGYADAKAWRNDVKYIEFLGLFCPRGSPV